MRRIIAIAALVATTACTNPHTGQIDPWATGLAVGAGALAVGALGYAAGQNSVPSHTTHHYHAPRYHHVPRRPGSYIGGYPAHPRYDAYRRW